MASAVQTNLNPIAIVVTTFCPEQGVTSREGRILSCYRESLQPAPKLNR